MIALLIILALVAALGWQGFSSLTILGAAALAAVLMGDAGFAGMIVWRLSTFPEHYLLMTAIFALALGRAVETHRGDASPSPAWLDTGPSPLRAAVRWLVAALASLPRAVGADMFRHGRHVSLAMMFPIGIPVLLAIHISEVSVAGFAGAMGLPFLILLALCALRPPAAADRFADEPPAAAGQALPVLVAFALAFSGIATWIEAMAVAAALSCLLLVVAAGREAVWRAQARALADSAVLAAIVILTVLIYQLGPLDELYATGLIEMLFSGGPGGMVLLAAAAALGALAGPMVCVAIILPLLLYGWTTDITALSVPLLLAAEAGRYARAEYLRASEGVAIDSPWIAVLAGLALATWLFPDILRTFSAAIL